MRAEREPASSRGDGAQLPAARAGEIEGRIAAAQQGGGDPPVDLQRRRAELAERIAHWETAGAGSRRAVTSFVKPCSRGTYVRVSVRSRRENRVHGSTGGAGKRLAEVWTRRRWRARSIRRRTMREMADALEVSPSTVQLLAEEARAAHQERSRAGGRDVDGAKAAGDHTPRADAMAKRSTSSERHGGYRCKRCRSGSRRTPAPQDQSACLSRKRADACVLCGYDRCHGCASSSITSIRATKSFGLAHAGITRAIDDVRREAEKCVLALRATAMPRSRLGSTHRAG